MEAEAPPGVSYFTHAGVTWTGRLAIQLLSDQYTMGAWLSNVRFGGRMSGHPKHAPVDRSEAKDSAVLDKVVPGEARRRQIKKGDFPFTNLCIEGGGARGVALGGTMKALDAYGIIPQLKRFVGSSAGAIGCTLLAAGYTTEEVHGINMTTDFTKFMDDSWGMLRDSRRFVQSYGLCPGTYFEQWMEDKLSNKLDVARVTFKQFFDLTGKDLRITSVCVNDDKLVVFSYKTHPCMRIALAVRASMSIPGVFCPVEIKGKLYVDGGLSDNYPLDEFDEDNPYTLGLKLMGDGETRDARVHNKQLPTGNVVEYYGAIISHMCNSIERLKIDEKYWPRTIRVPTGDIGTTEFDLSEERKKAAVDKAYNAAIEQLEYFREHKEFAS
jgi:NTE family protein